MAKLSRLNRVKRAYLDNTLIARLTIVASLFITWAIIFIVVFFFQSTVESWPPASFIDTHRCSNNTYNNSEGDCILDNLRFRGNETSKFNDLLAAYDDTHYTNITYFIAHNLIEFGWNQTDILVSEFEAESYQGTFHGHNIMVESKVNSNSITDPEIIVVFARLDRKETTGAATLLEIAEVFGAGRNNGSRSLYFVFENTNSDYNYASSGDVPVNQWLDELKKRDKLDNVVAIIQIEELVANPVIHVGAAGVRGGFTPQWLRTLVEFSAREASHFKVVDYSFFWEYIFRAVALTLEDYGVLLSSGLTAVSIKGEKDQGGFIFRNKLSSFFSEGSSASEADFEGFGRAIEYMILVLTDVDVSIPLHQPMTYLRTSDARYLSKGLVTFAQLLAFLPLLCTLLLGMIQIYRTSEYLTIHKWYQHYYFMHPQFMYFLRWFISLLSGWAVAEFILISHFLPYHSSSSKYMFDQKVNFYVLGLVWGTVLLVRMLFWLFGTKLDMCRCFGRPKKEKSSNEMLDDEVEELFNEHTTYNKFLFTNSLHLSPTSHRRFILLSLLLLLVILSPIRNTFASSLLLIVPCYTWPLVSPRASEIVQEEDIVPQKEENEEEEKKRERRKKALKTFKFILNIFVVLLTPLVVLIVCWLYTWPNNNIVWYITLSIVYGHFTPLTILSFCALFALVASFLKYVVDHKVSGSRYIAYSAVDTNDRNSLN